MGGSSRSRGLYDPLVREWTMRERVGIFQEVLVHYELRGDNYIDST